MPHVSNLNCHVCTIQGRPSVSARVSLHTYCTLFLLINTSLASLLSVFVEILSCKAEEPGPLSLTTRCQDLVLLPPQTSPISGWGSKPYSKLLQVEAIRDQHNLTCCLFLMLKEESCGAYMQWNITQPLKRIHFNRF